MSAITEKSAEPALSIQITAKGLLIHDPFDKLTEVYDGQTFPSYYYRSDYVVDVMIGYNDRQELLLLPEEELAIRKAFARLGAPSIHDCTIGIDPQSSYLNSSRFLNTSRSSGMVCTST